MSQFPNAYCVSWKCLDGEKYSPSKRDLKEHFEDNGGRKIKLFPICILCSSAI